MSYYSDYDRTRASPRKEWDDFLMDVRRRLGCDSRTIPSCFKVERRYLAHSMKLIIYCDWESPREGEFKLGYVEIHEEGLVSYEYHADLRLGDRPAKEVFLRQSDSGWKEQIDAFVDDVKATATTWNSIVVEREKARQLQLAEEKRRQAEEKARAAEEARVRKAQQVAVEAAEAARLAEERAIREAEQRRVRRIKDAARRERQREARSAQRAEQARLRELREAEEAKERVEREAREEARRQRQARLDQMKAAREERFRAEVQRRREEWAEVGVVVPEFTDEAGGVKPERWRPHPADLVLWVPTSVWIIIYLLYYLL